jgi:MFS family permease
MTAAELKLKTTDTATAVTPHLIRSLVAVIAGSLVLRVAAQMMGQMLQYYFNKIHHEYFEISYTTTGLITASFFATELLGSPVLGALSDRYGRKLFIILGPLFGAIAVQITSMTVAIWLLVITRLLEGLSTASSIPATLGYISESTSGRPDLRARIIGLFEVTFIGGIAIGATLGGYIWEAFADSMTIAGLKLISPAFSIDGLVYLLSLAIFAWGLKNTKGTRSQNASLTNERARLSHYLAILRSPRVWRFVPAWLAINSIIGMWINHGIRLLSGRERYDNQLLMGAYREAQLGNGYAAFAVIFAGGVLAWSFTLGRHRKTSIMLIATGGLFTSLFSVYCLNHFDHASAIFYPVLIAFVLGLLVLSGFTPAALTYLADATEAHAEARGSIMGLYSVFLGVGQVIGTVSGGRFADWAGVDGLLLASAIFGSITAVTLAFLRKQESDVSRR